MSLDDLQDKQKDIAFFDAHASTRPMARDRPLRYRSAGHRESLLLLIIAGPTTFGMPVHLLPYHGALCFASSVENN